MPAVVTIGETMAMLMPTSSGRIRHAQQLELRVGGAESNVAIGLARLGIDAGWAGWLGDDEVGELVLSRIRGEGVDTSQVRRIDRRTGLFLRERAPLGVQVYYYRHDSAATAMGPDAFAPTYLDGVQFLHLTGITPALSDTCRELIFWAIGAARRHGVRICFDVNYRSKLWRPEVARATIEEILPLVDIVLVGDEEAQALWQRADRAWLETLTHNGPTEVVLKRGAAGCFAIIDGEMIDDPGFVVAAVDPIGAGDAFAAGYLAGHVWGESPQARLRTANALGALSVMTVGDYEGLPSRAELRSFLSGTEGLGR